MLSKGVSGLSGVARRSAANGAGVRTGKRQSWPAHFAARSTGEIKATHIREQAWNRADRRSQSNAAATRVVVAGPISQSAATAGSSQSAAPRISAQTVQSADALARAIHARLSATTSASERQTRRYSSRPFVFSAAVDTEAEAKDAEEVVVDVDSSEVAAEEVKGEKKQHSFQAETKQILNIMARSLYTDKEVFLRELISNASDALEKCRYLQQGAKKVVDPDLPMEIRIDLNEEANTLTIRDYGVGMSESDLVENLGTIARSGSKAFVQAMESGADASNIIGQFGVGFYATFMVADRIEVFSRYAVDSEEGNYWVSDGSGSYEISQASGVARGTKIVCHLKDEEKEFATKARVEAIVKKYSNFVGFPIFLNGERVNTVEALWTKSPGDVSDEEHTNFYKYLSGAWDAPMSRLHFVTDVPVAIKSLFYVPSFHMEKHGMGRIDPGVGLYSRKVLIQAKCTLVLPDWLRFVRGVVDSEDIPLNISRESMQDSALIARIKNVLTRRIIRHFDDVNKKDKEEYAKFFKEFGNFIKEGVCTDFNHKNDIARLLRFESSREKEGEMVSFDDYISRMYPEQKGIYFLQAPSRALAEASPYYESFKKKGVEVLFLFAPIDDFVMKNLSQYNKRNLVSVESAAAGAESGPANADKKADTDADKDKPDVDEKTSAELCQYLQDALKERVSSVVISNRLVSTPAIVVDHESASMRRMMQYVDQNVSHELPKQKLEINPTHPVMQSLLQIRDKKPELAQLVAEQVFDNALIAADILDKPQSMLPRLNQILAQALQGYQKKE